MWYFGRSPRIKINGAVADLSSPGEALANDAILLAEEGACRLTHEHRWPQTKCYARLAVLATAQFVFYAPATAEVFNGSLEDH